MKAASRAKLAVHALPDFGLLFNPEDGEHLRQKLVNFCLTTRHHIPEDSAHYFRIPATS
jgi:hypothetical protein